MRPPWWFFDMKALAFDNARRSGTFFDSRAYFWKLRDQKSVAWTVFFGVRATINLSRSSLDDKRAERDMAPQQKSKTNHVEGKRERKKEARRMRLRFIDESSCGASVLPGKQRTACFMHLSTPLNTALFSVQKSSQPQPLIHAERMRAARAASPWTPSTDWLSRCCEPWNQMKPNERHVQQSHTRKTGRSKKRRWSFNGFHNWMLEKRHKNVTQTFSGLNLNTINASASGLWQIKTAHKNLGCASVFMTVFICHKPSAFAFIVYVKLAFEDCFFLHLASWSLES